MEPGQRASFALQQRMHVVAPSPTLLCGVPVFYFVFDVLFLDGEQTVALPYEQQRALLADLGLAGEAVRTPADFSGVDGATVLQAAKLHGFEGVL